jgi:hypothetical protein
MFLRSGRRRFKAEVDRGFWVRVLKSVSFAVTAGLVLPAVASAGSLQDVRLSRGIRFAV